MFCASFLPWDLPVGAANSRVPGTARNNQTSGARSLMSRESTSLYRSSSLSPFPALIAAWDPIGRASAEPPRRRRGRQKGWSRGGCSRTRRGEGARTAAVPPPHPPCPWQLLQSLRTAPETRGSGISLQTLPANSWPDALSMSLSKGEKELGF